MLSGMDRHNPCHSRGKHLWLVEHEGASHYRGSPNEEFDVLRRQTRELQLMLAMIRLGCKLKRAMSTWEIDAAFRRVSLGQSVEDVVAFLERRQSTL